MKSYIEVRVQVRMNHRWKNAPERRKYLRELHPHNFEVRLELQVFESDREIEFHDLLEWLNKHLQEVADISAYATASCETMAKDILRKTRDEFGKTREIEVEVWEDTSCGGKVKYKPIVEGLEKLNHVEGEGSA